MSLRGERFGSAVKSGLGAFRRLGLKRWALLLTGLAAWVLGDSELARYWRRNTLENMDFDRYFLKYLVYSEAFRIDLCYWLVTTLLQTAAMAFCLYFILSWLLSKEDLRIQMCIRDRCSRETGHPPPGRPAPWRRPASSPR